MSEGSQIKDVALRYVQGGLSVIPIRADGSKSPPPMFGWKKFQERRPSPYEISQNFRSNVGLAVLGGTVSGNLEVIDIERAETVKAWIELVDSAAPGLLENITRVQTPRGGAHFYYRSAKIQGNQKLAMEPAVDEKGRPTQKVLIETRGEGGYVLAPPCPGECHPTGNRYVHISGPELPDVTTVTEDERRLLLETARSFNKVPSKVKRSKEEKDQPGETDRLLPGNDFNVKATWEEILEPAGWAKTRTLGEVGYWRRPGKNDPGCSATTEHHPGKLHVFSTNALPFEADTEYSKFAAYATLNHGGNFSKAAKELSSKGFGAKNGEYKSNGGIEEDERSDIVAAHQFVSKFGAEFLYCEPWKHWLVWDGQRWTQDRRNQAFSRATTVAENSGIKRHKAERISATLRVAQPMLASVPEEFDQDPWVINCPNGILNLKTGIFGKNDPANRITSLCPTKFNPEAKAPLWEKFLSDIMKGDTDLISYLQRLSGYALTGVIRDHILPILYGIGNNGKSTFLGTLRKVFGSDYACESAPDLLMTKNSEAHPTERADLAGKRLVTTIEVEDGRHLAENFVKQLTGGDDLKVRRMRENFWTLKPTWKIFLATNNKPEIRGMDFGIWRRVRLIPFTVVIPPAAQDTELGEKLLLEAEGILAWAIRGCEDWKNRALRDPKLVLEATEEYKVDADILGRFFSDCCVILPQLKASASALYETFREWHEKEIGTEPMNGTVFGRRLTEHGFRVEKISGKKWRIGIGIGELSWKTQKLNEF